MKIGCVIAAAGDGSRFGAKKQFAKINGRFVIDYSVDVLKQFCDDMVIIVKKEDEEFIRNIFSFAKIVIGGERRMDSVYNGLCAVDCDIVLVHDAARPLISRKLVNDIINTAKVKKSCIPVVKIAETVKYGDGRAIKKTINRDNLYLSQTPQAFDYGMLKNCYDKIISKGITYTDESNIWEEFYGSASFVTGDRKNIKITTKEDLEIVKCLLG